MTTGSPSVQFEHNRSCSLCARCSFPRKYL